jgi:hypothetical protein
VRAERSDSRVDSCDTINMTSCNAHVIPPTHTHTHKHQTNSSKQSGKERGEPPVSGCRRLFESPMNICTVSSSFVVVDCPLRTRAEYIASKGNGQRTYDAGSVELATGHAEIRLDHEVLRQHQVYLILFLLSQSRLATKGSARGRVRRRRTRGSVRADAAGCSGVGSVSPDRPRRFPAPFALFPIP